MEHCLLCDSEVTEELQCKWCKHVCHFRCAFGRNVSIERNKEYFRNGPFSCAICLVGRSNKFIIKALSTNQTYNQSTHATDFVFHADTDTVDEEDKDGTIVVEDVQPTLTHPTHTPASDQTNHDAEQQSQRPPPPLSGNPPHLRHSSPGQTNQDVEQRSQGTPPPPSGNPLRLRDNSSGALEAEAEYTTQVSQNELRRIKRAKGMLYGLKHISSSIETLLILDSNGRDVTGESIDGAGDKVCVRTIGGLCVPATTAALKQCKIRYPNIKTLAIGLGTNDHLHNRQHPGDKETYLQDLDSAAKVVFPRARLTFLLPFSGIKGLGEDYVNDLSRAITNSGVRWRKCRSPSMKGNLQAPQEIHLTVPGRKIFIDWLKKLFAPRRLPHVPDIANSLPNQGDIRPRHTSSAPPSRLVHRANQFTSNDPPSAATSQTHPPADTNQTNDVRDIVRRVVGEMMREQRMGYGFYPPGHPWYPG